MIVRTAAEGASAEDIERDLDFLQKLWKPIQARAKAAKAPTLVYQEAELPLRVDPRPLHRRLRAGAGRRRPDAQAHRRLPEEDLAAHGRARRRATASKAPLFESFGVDAEIRSTLSRRVDLPSGGYLIFDYAEAFTVIDVNTGRFVGSRSKSSGAPARGHGHEEQPRGGQGGRPPAAAARHRRDHRHRLHRHGEPEEPRRRSRRRSSRSSSATGRRPTSSRSRRSGSSR